MQIPVPNDWDKDDDGYVLLTACVPNSLLWIAAAKGSIYALLRGRTYDSATGNVKHAQAIGWDIFESVNMICLDDITRIAASLERMEQLVGQSVLDPQVGVNDMTNYITQNCGCCGQPSPPTSGGITGGTPSPTTPAIVSGLPAGFTDEGEFLAYKCKVAHKIVDDMIADVQFIHQWADWTRTTVNTLSTVALAAGLLTPVVGDEVLILLFTIAAQIITTRAVWIDEALAALTNHRDSLICALYSTSDVQGADAAITTALQNAVAAETTLAYYIIYPILSYLVTVDSLNRLYVLDATINALPTQDCSNCAAPPSLVTPTQSSACSVQFASVPNLLQAGVPDVPFGSGSLAMDGLPRVLSSVEADNGQHAIAFSIGGEYLFEGQQDLTAFTQCQSTRFAHEATSLPSPNVVNISVERVLADDLGIGTRNFGAWESGDINVQRESTYVYYVADESFSITVLISSLSTSQLVLPTVGSASNNSTSFTMQSEQDGADQVAEAVFAPPIMLPSNYLATLPAVAVSAYLNDVNVNVDTSCIDKIRLYRESSTSPFSWTSGIEEC